MLAVVTLSLALQVSVRVGPTREDSLRQRQRDSIAVMIEESIRARQRDRRPPRRDSVTSELERTAFRDPQARELLHRARAARLEQDSSLQSYDATAHQRVSVGLGVRATGRNRLLYRAEAASRVRWSRGNGVWIDVKGRRAVAPSFDDDGNPDIESDLWAPMPYYPGREALWIGSNDLARAEVDDRELVHPIATGSEAYYRYSTGDSLILTLPGGTRITLRELRIEPRRPEWRLSVGSFWFDAASGQLVRAVYRFAAPMDIWAVAREESQRAKADPGRRGGMTELRELEEEEDIPWIAKAMMSPLKANLEAVTIEYGLFGGRFWLPRTQYAEAKAQAGFLHIPVRIEESFTYASVNGPEAIPEIPAPPKTVWDSLFGGDSIPYRDLPLEERRARNRAVARAAMDRAEARRRARDEECAATGFHTRAQDRIQGTLRMAIRVPCDTTVLVNAPELSGSIYDSAEELFGAQQRDELLKALDFGLQSAWAPQRPAWEYGLTHTRYNRIEGFSTGIAGSMALGRGYTADGGARIGLGDRRPNVEVGIARSNAQTTWRLGAYRRLDSVSDWGSPLSFGASLGAFLFGRDDGFYARAAGADLVRRAEDGGTTWRFFAERQAPAPVTTGFSVARGLGTSSRFVDNIVAERGNALGASVRDFRSLGLDPRGWRLLSDLRLEGGWFDSLVDDTTSARSYGRAALDLTVSRGFGDRTAAALTVGAGVSDQAAVQRHFLLGGSETVRGQRPGTMSGESYWMGRLEVGRGLSAARLVAFGDVGWAGPRSLWSRPGRPMSGAGVGVSFLDGLFRADLARGIHPSKRFRFDMYVEARF
jgi:hypothetical protein